MNAIQALMQPWRLFWEQRSRRERAGLKLASLVVLLAVLWQWGFSPALRIWNVAASKQAQIFATTQQMLSLEAQASKLIGTTPMNRSQAVKALQDPSFDLGPGVRFTTQGDQLKVEVARARASELARWMVAAREQARCTIQEAALKRLPNTNAEVDVVWQGSLTVRLP
jgi:type II secretory pathway component PulM